jgi:hypothetical protein
MIDFGRLLGVFSDGGLDTLSLIVLSGSILRGR